MGDASIAAQALGEGFSSPHVASPSPGLCGGDVVAHTRHNAQITPWYHGRATDRLPRHCSDVTCTPLSSLPSAKTPMEHEALRLTMTAEPPAGANVRSPAAHKRIRRRPSLG